MTKRARTFALLAALAVCAETGAAADLLEVYQLARTRDPQFLEAGEIRTAALEAKPQARAALLPQLYAGGEVEKRTSNGSGTFLQVVDPGLTPGVDPQIEIFNVAQRISADAWRWQVGLSQTVFRWDQWQRLGRADSVVARAEVAYRAAQQDLMLRVSQRYFDVLAATETLRASEATLESFTQQLAQAERRFKAGVVTVVDVEEARSARDAAAAGVIAAKRALALADEALTELTGEPQSELKRLGDELPASDVAQRTEQAWVDQALEQNLGVVASRFGVDIATRDVRIAQSGYMPSLELYAATSGMNENATETVTNRTLDLRTKGPADSDGTEDVVGLRLVVPIFTGGATSSRVREQVALHRASQQRLDGSLRAAERSTRDAYLSVVADLARVEALRQSVASSRSALRATERGMEVGNRTIVDVLDSRRRVFDAERDYAWVRYNYLINLVRLRAAAGSLLPADLDAINKYLVEVTSVVPSGAPRR
ncbi:MAG: TolC family outer membrane protein [Gammaproteobacteria bacterium]|nr:TolC family outer membrane protein [Gammaproteobacteria bacterium]